MGLLLGASRRRARGRRNRQRALLTERSGKPAGGWAKLGLLLPLMLTATVNAAAAFLVIGGVAAGQRIAAEQQGRIIVDAWFAHSVRGVLAQAGRQAGARGLTSAQTDAVLQPSCDAEAKALAAAGRGDEPAIASRLRLAVHVRDPDVFVTREQAAPGLAGLSRGGAPAALGSLALLVWSVMLVMQGEGLELDVQRRRNPMWEWLFSHPAPPAAIFLAEMLAPIVANPVYYTAPLLPGILYGALYGPAYGVLAFAAIGLPVTLAAGCLAKALETGVMLRCAPRSRGALIGVMGWLGYASMLLIFAGLYAGGRLAPALAGLAHHLPGLPWPWLGLFLGQLGDGSFSFLAGVLACCGLAGLTIAGSLGLSLWGARRGLTGRVGRLDAGPRPARDGRTRFGKGALTRKELTWFMRDRSVVVQVILVPITAAGFQLFNLRGLLVKAGDDWASLCGAGVLFGTYFLFVLGPKSLASEGAALWLPLTWPQGLEELLKAKARLWAGVSTAVVGLVLCYAAWRFPEGWWGIGLVGVGWFLFARSMAQKAVTLATVTAESGERQKVPAGRQWATMLGTFSFAVGVLSRQWPLAVVGVVYSTITAAAMWQNFRARLPFLYDPWSEPLPRAPTLMHAMIAISGLVEASAVLTAILLPFVGHDGIAVAQAVSYAGIAAVVSFWMAEFLRRRGIRQSEVWVWPAGPWARRGKAGVARLLAVILAGAGLGAALGLAGRLYLLLLRLFPWGAALLDQSAAQLAAVPHLRAAYFVMAVAVAPFAEEYLFRGLLYRALDREWGGWRAVAGSAAFFAIYHPPLSWLPVGALGVVNALLFKRTGRLAPAVALHMAYNAVVLA